jgi:hypothetical protein
VENISNRGCDFGKFEAETYYHAEYQQHDEELEGAQGTHVSRGIVEDEDDENVDDG